MSTTPRLAEHCSRLFLFLTTFRRNAASTDVDLQWVRRNLISLFEDIEAAVAREPELKRDYEKAKYPLVALADEVLLNTEWSGQEEWDEDLLEEHYFGTSIAGEDFYRRLQELAPEEDQVGEIYFLCLSLGFKGRYRSRPEEREEMKQRLYRSIPGRLASKSDSVCPGVEEGTVETDITMIPAAATARVLVILVGIMIVSVLIGRIVATQRLSDLAAVQEQIKTLPKSG